MLNGGGRHEQVKNTSPGEESGSGVRNAEEQRSNDDSLHHERDDVDD